MHLIIKVVDTAAFIFLGISPGSETQKRFKGNCEFEKNNLSGKILSRECEMALASHTPGLCSDRANSIYLQQSPISHGILDLQHLDSSLQSTLLRPILNGLTNTSGYAGIATTHTVVKFTRPL